MKKLELNEIRKIQIEILNVLDDFCKEQGIKYFLCNGTLLGAVKYKGYIPWDDDIDVCLLREDYDKLISLFDEKNANDKYQLFCFEKNENYFFPFAKICNKETILVEKGFNNGVDIGLNIDIFPIDNFGNSVKETSKKFKKCERARSKLNLSKLSDFSSSNKFRSLLKKVISFPFRKKGPQYFVKKIDKIAKTSTKETKYIGNCVWGFYGIGEAHKKSVFSKTILKEFEGREYPIPIGYDDYLHGLYGNWREDPPIDKQCTHHCFEAYYKQD